MTPSNSRAAATRSSWKLDRLARSMKQLIETVETLRMRGEVAWGIWTVG
jgi:hypothetical protein